MKYKFKIDLRFLIAEPFFITFYIISLFFSPAHLSYIYLPIYSNVLRFFRPNIKYFKTQRIYKTHNILLYGTKITKKRKEDMQPQIKLCYILWDFI